jgi:hypothetical protein
VIPVGTKVLLSVHSLELLALANGAESIQKAASGAKNRRRCRYDGAGVPERIAPAAVRARNAEGGGEEDDNNDEDAEGAQGAAKYITAWVDLCRSFAPREVRA